MVKHLLIGASALATLSAAPAMAQELIDYGSSPIDAAALVGSFGAPDTATNASTDPETRKGDKAAADASATEASTIMDAVDDVVLPGGSTAAANAAAGNTAAIEQEGNFNFGNIDQTESTRGLALINQEGTGLTTASRPNTSDITQKDDGSTGVANGAYIQQIGDNNDADITQDWQSAKASLVASGAPTANSAVILQGITDSTSRRGRSNDAEITQKGAGNDAVVAQVFPGSGQGGTTYGSGNDGSILQDGVSNTASLQQSQSATATANGLDVGAPAGITQIGNLNESYVSQLQGVVTAGVSQRGDRNFAVVSQGSPTVNDRSSANANQAVSNVFQTGNDNTLWSEQNRDADQASSSAIQTGNGNYGEVRQFAFNTKSELTSTGDNNSAFVTQAAGADNSESYVNQLGNNNQAVVFQAVASDYASISQTGNNNQAHVNQ